MKLSSSVKSSIDLSTSKLAQLTVTPSFWTLDPGLSMSVDYVTTRTRNDFMDGTTLRANIAGYSEGLRFFIWDGAWNQALALTPTSAAFQGAITSGGVAVALTSDSRLTNTRTPSPGSVTDSTIVAGGISQSSVSGLTTSLSAKVDSTDIRLTDARTPTDGSVTDAKIVAGGLAQSSINGLSTTLAGKVDTTDSRLTDTRTPTDSSVTTAKIANAAVTDAKLANAAVTDAKLADAKLSLASGGTVTGNVTFNAPVGLRSPTWPTTTQTGLWTGVVNDCAVRLLCNTNSHSSYIDFGSTTNGGSLSTLQGS